MGFLLCHRVRGLWCRGDMDRIVRYRRGCAMMGLAGRDHINQGHWTPSAPSTAPHSSTKRRHVPGWPGKPARRGQPQVGSGCSSWQRLFLEISTGGRCLFCLETRWGKERIVSHITEQIPSVRPCGCLWDGVVGPIESIDTCAEQAPSEQTRPFIHEAQPRDSLAAAY